MSDTIDHIRGVCKRLLDWKSSPGNAGSARLIFASNIGDNPPNQGRRRTPRLAASAKCPGENSRRGGFCSGLFRSILRY